VCVPFFTGAPRVSRFWRPVAELVPGRRLFRFGANRADNRKRPGRGVRDEEVVVLIPAVNTIGYSSDMAENR
jgi:hypothetical protein